MREAVERTRAKILNNGSSRGTNDAVPEFSMSISMSKSFYENKTGMAGIERKDNNREEENMRRSMREEFDKSARDEFCAILQHRSEATRKYHKRLMRETVDSMRDQ